MKTILLIVLSLCLILHCALGQRPSGEGKLSVLVVTGGKSFDREAFMGMFSSFGDVITDTASKPGVFDLFTSDDMSRYQAIIFYDTYQPITDGQKNAFLRLFERGIGCVFLHHALVSHQDWKEYEDILGGRYHHTPYLDEGRKYGPSTYKHDQEFTIRLIDPSHPVTSGLSDFPIVDEVYINFEAHKIITPLLTTDHRESGEYVGWTKMYRNSRIVYLQPGHDARAYENPGYRRLVHNAIQWVAEAR